MRKPVLIKLGGSILQDEKLLQTLSEDIKSIHAKGFKIIIVHGGSKAINESLKVHNIETDFIQGLRKTPLAAMKIIEMVLCGQVNQAIVRKLNQVGVPAIGLSGATNQTLLCNYINTELGFVGEIKDINTDYLKFLLSSKENFIPVIATLGVDKTGNAMNINADFAAAHIANALAISQVIYLTDQAGIYEKNGMFYTKLTELELNQLVQQSVVKDGMLVKVKAILQSLKHGLNNIMVASGREKNILIDLILLEKNVGTLCIK